MISACYVHNSSPYHKNDSDISILHDLVVLFNLKDDINILCNIAALSLK